MGLDIAYEKKKKKKRIDKYTVLTKNCYRGVDNYSYLLGTLDSAIREFFSPK